MALSSSTLARALLAISDPANIPRTPEEAGQKWAQAYADYAAAAMSPVAAPPASLAAGQAVLARALGATFRTSLAAPQTASQMAAAFTAFWLTPPVVFGAGLVTAVTGTTVLAAGLPGVWAANTASSAPAEPAMQRVAGLLDVFTHTVIVTTPGAPPVVGPIV